MTKRQAILSLRIGLFCGRVDTFLKGNYFTTICRKKVDDFTEEFFLHLKEVARRLEVPDEVIEEQEEDKETVQELIDNGTLDALMEVQNQIDNRT